MVILGRPCLYISNFVLSDLLSKFKKLRVLSLKYYYIAGLPDSIGCLRHLRYLDLSHTTIRTLPESTGSLYNLQVLILRGCLHLMKLPSNIGNLINLHHFDITGVVLIKEMPLGMKKLKSLHVLSNFIVGKDSGSHMSDLKNLKFLRGQLCISRLDNITDLLDTRQTILFDKQDLEVLMLEWGSQFDDSRDEVTEKKCT
ncbi:hypothetical protein Dsin_022793 [Dipteronia sinensis]|uniref:Disease resistance R13L4/SHOC-2-like LRR domain-containing protein n=1 Tax=Dipteronia sinensis TaxID=43782 RepID=A0AAE0A219_9ROSI|nr:hypothetical protein Dsin_022793 [Dipteronia sinensis]